MLAVVDSAEKTLVVVGHSDTDDQRTQYVEREQAVDKAISRLGNVTARSFCFSSSCDYKFGRHDEGESRFYEGIPKGKEFACIALSDKGVESSLVACKYESRDIVRIGAYRVTLFPVSETESIMVGTTTKEENNTEHDETEDSEDLDRTEYKLCFSEERNSNDVQCENDEQDDGNPDSDGYALSPVLDDNRGGGNFSGKQHREGVPVVPS
jgi:hypothetical protein